MLDKSSPTFSKIPTSPYTTNECRLLEFSMTPSSKKGVCTLLMYSVCRVYATLKVKFKCARVCNIVPQLRLCAKQSSSHTLKVIESEMIFVYAFPRIPLYHSHIVIPTHLWTITSSVQNLNIMLSSHSYKFCTDSNSLAPSKVRTYKCIVRG